MRLTLSVVSAVLFCLAVGLGVASEPSTPTTIPSGLADLPPPSRAGSGCNSCAPICGSASSRTALMMRLFCQKEAPSPSPGRSSLPDCKRPALGHNYSRSQCS